MLPRHQEIALADLHRAVFRPPLKGTVFLFSVMLAEQCCLRKLGVPGQSLAKGTCRARDVKPRVRGAEATACLASLG